MDSPALVDIVVQCVDKRATPLLFSKGCCVPLFLVDIGGAAEINDGDSFVNVGDSYPVRLPSTKFMRMGSSKGRFLARVTIVPGTVRRVGPISPMRVFSNTVQLESVVLAKREEMACRTWLWADVLASRN